MNIVSRLDVVGTCDDARQERCKAHTYFSTHRDKEISGNHRSWYMSLKVVVYRGERKSRVYPRYISV